VLNFFVLCGKSGTALPVSEFFQQPPTSNTDLITNAEQDVFGPFLPA
jgi:hypothetical protein